MERLQISTLANQDITSPLLVSTYTATADAELMVNIYMSGLAGNGAYRACVTKQLAGAGSIYQSETMVLALAATVTTGFIPTIAIPVNNTDVLKVYVQGLAGDATVGVITEIFDAQTQNDDVASEVWSYTSRTLTQAAATVADVVSGSSVTIQRGDTLSATLTGLGALTGYVTLDWTVKHNKDDTDAESVIKIRKNASGVGDGLLYINGAAGTAGNGSITINDAATGSITIALAAADTDDLAPAQGYYYDVQMITASAVTTLSSGTCNVSADVTRAIA